MRAQLLHLSGPFRGRTVTYPQRVLVIGTGGDATVRFPPGRGVADRHAELAFVEEGCAFYLKALDGDVFVNRKQVREVILEPGDLIELGVGGPKLRFRVHMDTCRPCKPVRQMLGDARDVGSESGVFASAGAIGHDLVRHSSTRLRTGVVLLTLFAAITAGTLGGWLGGTTTARRTKQLQADLTRRYERQIDALREQMKTFRRDQAGHVSQEEFDRLRGKMAQQAAFVDTMVRRNQALKKVLDDYARGVCLIHGTYTFTFEHEGETGHVTGPDGQPLEIEYIGSGFLAADDGRIVTNRHVAQPWWSDPVVAPLLEQDIQPTFVQLTATFPGKAPAAVDPSTIRLRPDEVDVAVMRVADVSDVPVLPLHDGPVSTERGDRVVLLGYPTGLNAMLARADADVVKDVLAAATDTASLLAELAGRDAISPVITQGALNEVLPKRLVYDADTTSGGSGGPVFGPDGTVIGVNFAVTRDFGGSNFGVPIRYARTLLEP